MANILLLLLLQTQIVDSATGSIAGRVQNSAGQPLAGAVVSIGEFTRVRADSLAHYRLPVGKAVQLDFVLDTMQSGVVPAGSIFGVVRDAAGHPVPSAMVIIRDSRHRALTDSLGRYLIDSVPPGAIQLTVRCLGYTPVAFTDTILTGRRVERNFVLRAAPPLLPTIAR